MRGVDLERRIEELELLCEAIGQRNRGPEPPRRQRKANRAWRDLEWQTNRVIREIWKLRTRQRNRQREHLLVPLHGGLGCIA